VANKKKHIKRKNQNLKYKSQDPAEKKPYNDQEEADNVRGKPLLSVHETIIFNPADPGKFHFLK